MLGVLGRVDGQAFLGFNGLVQAVSPFAVRHRSAGELIDDHDLSVVDEVLLAAQVEMLGRKRLNDSFLPPSRTAPATAQGLGQLGQDLLAAGRQVDLAVTFVEAIMLLLAEFFGQLSRLLEGFDRFGVRSLAGDYQRRDRLVDQNGIGFVDYGVVQSAHYHPARAFSLDDLGEYRRGQVADPPQHESVAQEVGCDLLVRAIGDVGLVCTSPVVRRHGLFDMGDLQAAELVDGFHPVRVALGQEIVEGHDVAPAAPPACDRRRQGRGEGLTLARGHLRHAAGVDG